MFYIGSALDVNKRYAEHASGVGAEWTKKYKPLIVSKTYECSSFGEALILEDAVTLWLMAKYSKGSVRGGRWMKEGHNHIYGFVEATKVINDKSLNKVEIKNALIDIVKWTIPDHSWYWDEMFEEYPKMKKNLVFAGIGKVPDIVKRYWSEKKKVLGKIG